MIFRKLCSAVRRIVDEVYSVYFNFKILPFNIALKLPIQVSHKVSLRKYYKGCIEIKGNVSRHMIKIGITGAPFINKENSAFYCTKDGKLIFEGRAIIAEGIKFFIENGICRIGEKAYIGCNTVVQCQTGVSIGNGFLGGWNLRIRDTDGHPIVCNGKMCAMTEKVEIGEHVWVAADCTILKGSEISSGSVVGCNSLVCGIKMEQPNCLIAGSPAKVIKEHIEWAE